MCTPDLLPNGEDRAESQISQREDFKVPLKQRSVCKTALCSGSKRLPTPYMLEAMHH